MSFTGSSSYISKYDYYTKHRNRMKALLTIIAIVIVVFNVWLVVFIVGKIKSSAVVRKSYKEAVNYYEKGVKDYDKELLDEDYNIFSGIKD